MAQKRILLVEDEEHLQEALKMNLEMEGYGVSVEGDGFNAVKRFKEEGFDLVVLDVMLPGMDGIKVCENIRLYNADIPILFLSAKNTGEDRILGLKKGGDDYLAKPFNLEELILRIKKLLDKADKTGTPKVDLKVFRFGDNWVNFETYEAHGVNGDFKLTKKEMLLLKLLVENKGQVVSREHILQTVWGYRVFPATRTIDNFILSFRKYFEPDPKVPAHFNSLRGVGYQFND